jgi:hypothetical protein
MYVAVGEELCEADMDIELLLFAWLFFFTYALLAVV